MSISDSEQVLMVKPHVNCVSEVIESSEIEYDELAWYLSKTGSDYCEVGTTLLIPTYRLEEVEEVIKPEKPGVPVEPSVGLSWKSDSGGCREIVSIFVHNNRKLVVVAVPNGFEFSSPSGVGLWQNYPHTPSTPAVTRKVKKWVKIEHPEVPE